MVVFASDYKPMDGGVAEFAHQLASFLYTRGRLAFVLSIVPQAVGEKFPVVAHRTLTGGWREDGDMVGDRFKWIAKINTVRFHWGILRSYQSGARRALGPETSLVMFTFVNSGYAIRLIDRCRARGKPYVLLFHGQDLIQMVQAGRKEWLVKAMGAAEQVIYNSMATRDLAIQLLGDPSDRNHILYPGLDFDVITSKHPALSMPRQEARASTESPTIVVSTLCRLVRRKGVHLVIEALRKVHDDRPDLRFEYQIAGKGPEEEVLQSMVHESPELDIHFLGFVSEHEKWALLQQSELFLMPNLAMDNDDFEGFGISFIEASYAGNWVVGGCHGGAVEAIEDKVTGWNIDVDGDAASERIAEVLIQYADNRAHYRELAANAPRVVRKRFDFPRLGDEWLRSLDCP